MADLSTEDLRLVEKIIRKCDLSMSDMEMTKKIVKYKRFKEYDTLQRFDTIRRSVSWVRLYFGLRVKINRKAMEKDYIRLRKEYPKASRQSISAKLKLIYPNFEINTFRTCINNFENYGEFKS